MSEKNAIREANRALNKEPKKITSYLLIPLNLARAFGAVAMEWIRGGEK